VIQECKKKNKNKQQNKTKITTKPKTSKLTNKNQVRDQKIFSVIQIHLQALAILT